MANFSIDYMNIQRLEKALRESKGNTEQTINEVLHEEAYPIFADSIKGIMPVSGRNWKGKRPPAKQSKSLQKKVGNLWVSITSSSFYNYLYFPDDGTNTRRHVGDQQFFYKGVKAQENEVIEMCVGRLVDNLEEMIE